MSQRVRPQLLLDVARPIRRPLPSWAAELTGNLEGLAGSHTPEELVELAAAFNLGALVLAFGGRSDAARAACADELGWVDSVASRTDRPAIRFLALPPWTNIGRVDRMVGRARASLEHFDLLHAFDGEVPVSLGPCRISEEDWRDIRMERGDAVRSFLQHVGVVDTWKALTIDGQDEAALEVAAAGSASVAAVAQEAVVFSLERLGRWSEALDESINGCREAPTYQRFVFQIHQLKILRETGYVGPAQELADSLAQVCISGTPARVGEEPFLRALAVLGPEAERAGALDAAVEVFRRGLDEATAAGDEPYAVLFLRGLDRTAGDSASVHRRALCELESLSRYVEVVHRVDLGPELETLRQTMSTLMGESS